MSAEAMQSELPPEHRDSLLYMMARRVINEEYAEHPIDFNAAGLEAGEKMTPGGLTSEQVVVDIGGNSGRMIAEAAVKTKTKARIICLEPDEGAQDVYDIMEVSLKQRVAFIRGVGEALPFADSSLQGATLHNVIFRASSATAMLEEVKRVVAPGGFVAISSNGEGHAYYRHKFERDVANLVMQQSGVLFAPPNPPAEGHYLEQLPALFEKIGGLKPIDSLYVPQHSRAIITRGERLHDYLMSIKYSAANTTTTALLYKSWHAAVDTVIEPQIQAKIAAMERSNYQQGTTQEPFFADTIQRGMFVLENTKST